MSQDITPIMQAAERLRRLESASHVRQVYPDARFPWEDVKEDRFTLADFALSILPKGKRPEPVTVDSLPIGARAWLHVDQHGCQGVYSVCASIMRGDATCFATEADAEEDMRHDLLKMLAR